MGHAGFDDAAGHAVTGVTADRCASLHNADAFRCESKYWRALPTAAVSPAARAMSVNHCTARVYSSEYGAEPTTTSGSRARLRT